MQPKTRKSNFLFIFVTLAMLALVTSACSFHVGDLGSITQVVTVTLTEEQFQDDSPNFSVGGRDFFEDLFDSVPRWEFHDGAFIMVHGHNFYEDLLDRVTRVELHDGYLRFFGTRYQADGTKVDGSLDLSLGAEDDVLVARITAVDIPGVTLADPLVVEINSEMTVDMTRLVTGDDDVEVLFKNVVVTEDVLKMTIQVNIDL